MPALEVIRDLQQDFSDYHNVSIEEASYFIFSGKLENQAYSMKKNTINLLRKNGEVIDVAKMSDQLNLEALSESVIKYYLCYPKRMR